jgi:hypothetical protein
LDDDDEVLENKNSCTMAGGEPTYLVMRGGNPGNILWLVTDFELLKQIKLLISGHLQ